MREVLYRAISMATGEHWIYGQPRHYAHNPHTEKWTMYDPATRIETDIDEETLGQYTGLTDKNGTKIFEGDILRYPPKERIEINNFVSYEVFWLDNDCADKHIGWQMNRHHYHGNICGRINDFTTCLPKYTEKMIIIGNIFDMKGGEE